MRLPAGSPLLQGAFALALGALAAATPAHAFQNASGTPAGSVASPSSRVVRNVVVRLGPSASTDAVGRLDPGETLAVVSTRPGWIEVRLPDGRTGWVSGRWVVVKVRVASADGRAFTLEAVDVGTGLSVLVTGRDFALLYDGGSNDDAAQGDGNRLVAFLRAVHPDLRRIDALVLSHPHRDHVELLADVLARYEVGAV